MTPSGAGGFAPFALPIFRLIWTAALASNIGSWMQSVGAQWLLVEGGSSPFTVSLLQTAAAAPVLMFAIPAGVLGEFLNRRRILIYAQTVQLSAVCVLTSLTWIGSTTPGILLATTFVLGVCSAIQLPAFAALIPDIVPAAMIRDAASLSSINVNIARAIGPAVAGLIVAQFGVAAVFLVNGLSFVLFLAVLVFWRTYHPPHPRPEPFLDATRAGLRYAAHSGIVRSTLIRLAVFLVPANAMWALLPVIAKNSLGLDAGGYGLLLGALGVGSIIGAVVLPTLRSRLGTNGVVLGSCLVYGAALVALVLSPSLWVTVLVLVAGGLGWLGVIATTNGSIQAFLPEWVRTRGLSLYQLVLYGGSALGSALSGALASILDPAVVVLGAGAAVLLVGATLAFRPLPSTQGIGRGVVSIPGLLDASEGSDDDRQVLVIIRYTVQTRDRDAFEELMRKVEQTRYRTGARRWELYTDRDDPEVLVEVYSVGSWREHVSQHEARATEYDSQLLTKAYGFSTPTPTAQHFLAVWPIRGGRVGPSSHRG